MLPKYIFRKHTWYMDMNILCIWLCHIGLEIPYYLSHIYSEISKYGYLYTNTQLNIDQITYMLMHTR
ncbi:hypothetical protein ACJX0J_036753, partial [Zea mays]